MRCLGQISYSFGFRPNILSMIVWEKFLTDFWSIFNHFTKKSNVFSKTHENMKNWLKFCEFDKNLANFWQTKFSDNHGQSILAKSHKLSKFSKACLFYTTLCKIFTWKWLISMKINVLDLFERFSFSFSSFIWFSGQIRP